MGRILVKMHVTPTINQLYKHIRLYLLYICVSFSLFVLIKLNDLLVSLMLIISHCQKTQILF